MTDLHAQIMNLPVRAELSGILEPLAYKLGHRDARHAAAELADAEITRLRAQVEEAYAAGRAEERAELVAVFGRHLLGQA